ncbi:MAG: 2-amino-4-hydroxy-6-hydroxymethyldihydropteridine diphosphokinase [Woeseiaceae bacterium]
MNHDRWCPAYIGLGSNLQGPSRQVESAIQQLDELAGTRLFAYSGTYRSAPYGGVEQPEFVNAVAAVLTQLGPRELLDELKALERARGREQGGQRWGPRILDLDILVYAERILEEDGLTLPHPGIAERNFVLLPLREIAPHLVIPGLGRVASIAVNEREPSIERIA